MEDHLDPALTETDALLKRQNHLILERPFLGPLNGRKTPKGYFDADEPRRGRGGRGGRASRKRGPRKAAEPTGDVKYRLNMATNAYMGGRIDEAIEYVEDAIRINAETHRAWMLLASFLEEKGNKKGH